MCLSLYVYEGHTSKTMDSMCIIRISIFRAVLVGKKCVLYTGKYDTHLCTWVERGTVRVKCLAQEHNAMSPAGQCLNADHSIRSQVPLHLPTSSNSYTKCTLVGLEGVWQCHVLGVKQRADVFLSKASSY